VRRDEHFEAVRLRAFEDTLHVVDSIVFSEALVEQGPRETLFTQDFVLRVDKYNCRISR
jgi:hypothetical protein